MKTSRRLSSADRALLIELARTRAALERRNLAREACRLGREVRPSRLLGLLWPRLLGRASPSQWLMAVPGLVSRYPLLTSGVTALLAASPARRWWRLGTALLMGWRWWRGRRLRRYR